MPQKKLRETLTLIATFITLFSFITGWTDIPEIASRLQHVVKSSVLGSQSTKKTPRTSSESTTSNSESKIKNADISTSFAGTTSIDTQLKVRQVLGRWQKAWQEKDLDMYMSTYADEAEIMRVTVRGGKEYPIKLTKSELRTKMKAIFSKMKAINYSPIERIISDVQVNGDYAVASDCQKFVGTPASGSRPAYSDYHVKTLILMVDANDGFWKIYSESWKIYEGIEEYPEPLVERSKNLLRKIFIH
jgi:ketosteroid isomerase-like protein